MNLGNMLVCAVKIPELFIISKLKKITVLSKWCLILNTVGVITLKIKHTI